MIQPADILLYRANSVFGRIIGIKTWSDIAHVEVSIGGGESVASRDGKGVGRYPHRSADLAHILRPVQPVDLEAALRWFRSMEGEPYGWLDLLAFVGWTGDAKGVVCSPFATQFLRAGGLPIFRGYPHNKIAPCYFLVSELLTDVSDPDRTRQA